MRGMRFLILLIIAIPLGWYAYYDSKKGPVDDTPKKDKVFAVESDKIDEIDVKSESGERTTLRKKGSDWEIVQPVTAASDQSAVSGITFDVVPALMWATVTTAGSNTSMVRVTIVCSACTISQATGIGSSAWCGADA